MSSQVEPVDIVTKRTITRVSVAVNSVVLFESVSLVVTIYDGEDVLETRLLKFEGDDYKGWKDDDAYLLRLTLERLGFVAATPTPAAPEPVRLAELLAPASVPEGGTPAAEPVQEPVPEPEQAPAADAPESA